MAGVIINNWENGRFVQRNINFDTILEQNKKANKSPVPEVEPDRDGGFGILTQTVVRSPITHWILPARLSNEKDHDVAFIGDTDVNIRRLDRHGRLRDAGHITDFGSRIRNASVIGSVLFDPGTIEEYQAKFSAHSGSGIFGKDQQSTSLVVEAGGDMIMTDASSTDDLRLGPQRLVLALESGDLIFLFATDRGPGFKVKPFISRHTPSRTLLGEQPGKHLSVDPSARYMAVAGSENVFAVYALRTASELRTQALNGETMRPIEYERYLHIQGVIHKMEFLFPAANDPDHIILLLLVVRNGTTRMHVYEWVAGQNLTDIRSNNKKGHYFNEEYKMPLLLIPLTIHSAFLMVCEQSIGLCKNLLEGTPDLENVNIGSERRTPLHVGLGRPLWTSWTRPTRSSHYAKNHDDIYIAREDGLVKFLEIDTTEFVNANMIVDGFENNIGTAFASLDSTFPGAAGSMGDIIIAGGDSCPGGIYLVKAREPARFLTAIPNWSPTIDFLTLKSKKEQGGRGPKTAFTGTGEPDKLFICTGRGSYGAVSEINYGTEAELWLELAELDYAIMESWVLPNKTNSNTEESRLTMHSSFLLSLANQTLLLKLEGDSHNIIGVEDTSSTWLDLDSRTVIAANNNGFTIQITERSIRMSAKSTIVALDSSDPALYRRDYPPDEVIIAAALYQNEYAVIASQNQNGELHLCLLRLFMEESTTDLMADDEDQRLPNIEDLGESVLLSRYPTSLSIVKYSAEAFTCVIGVTESDSTGHDSSSTIKATTSVIDTITFDGSRGFIQNTPVGLLLSLPRPDIPDNIPESCISTASLSGPDEGAFHPRLLVVGHRNGKLVMMRYTTSSKGDFQPKTVSSIHMGATPVIICADPLRSDTALVCCDSKLYRLVFDNSSIDFPSLIRVWLKSLATQLTQQPAIDRVAQFGKSLLVTSGRQIFCVELDDEISPIPRHIRLSGSPSRLLYCEFLDAVAVAISAQGLPRLVFIDPETGDNLNQLPGNGDPRFQLPSIPGRPGERILSLVEWKIVRKASAKRDVTLIVVGTSGGKLKIYEPRRDSATSTNPSDPNNLARIGCRTHSDLEFDGPVYAILPFGSYLFCCIKESVQLVQYDEFQKKLRIVWNASAHEMPSHGVSMQLQDGMLHVLTAKDSLRTYQFKEPRVSDSGELLDNGMLKTRHIDEVARAGIGLICYSGGEQPLGTGKSGIVLVADKDCSVVGLTYRQSAHVLPTDYETAFEAELPISIVKFRFGNTRRPWDMSWTGETIRGVLPLHKDGMDLLGIGIDGSVRSFTILQSPLRELLIFLQDLARRSALTSPNTHDKTLDLELQDKPTCQHVEGNLLHVWLELRCLDTVLRSNPETLYGGDNVLIDPSDEFLRLTFDYFGDDLNEPPNGDRMAAAINKVYILLGSLLRPVL